MSRHACWPGGGGLAARVGWLPTVLLVACASRATPSADAREGAGLPPLPTAPAAALPDDGEHVVQLSLGELRSSPHLAQLETMVAALPCLQQTRAPALVGAAEEVAVAAWSSAPDPGFVGFVTPSTDSEGWLAAIADGPGGTSTSPSPAASQVRGRHRRSTRGAYAVNRLSPDLLMLGTEARVAAAEQRFDDPAAPHAGFWLAVASEFRPGEGRVLSWATERLPEAAAVNLGKLVGSRVAGLIAGARMRAVVERGPVAVRLEAKLASEEAATAVRREVHRMLDQASFLLRLSGLPLDKRLESSQTGAVVRFDLPLQASEVQRILALAKAAWPPLGRDICALIESRRGRS